MTQMLQDLHPTRTDELVCPECMQAGVPAAEATFGSKRALGAHRYQSHGIPGEGRRSNHQKKKAKQPQRSKRARRAPKPAPEPLPPSWVDVPAEMSEREYSAYMLGSTRALLAVVGQKIDQPPAVVMEALHASGAYHEWVLAQEA